MSVWKEYEEVWHGRRTRYGIFIIIILVYLFLMYAFIQSLKVDPLLPALIVVVMIFLLPVFVFFIDFLFYEDQT